MLLGRRDARRASFNDAFNNIPPPFLDFPALLSNFQDHGLDLNDLVVLSGGHTIGLSRCHGFRDRIYNDTNIEPHFAASLRGICPRQGGDGNLATLDATTATFDTMYFKHLLELKGLLHSDQELFKDLGRASDGLVQYYSRSPGAFFADFGVSMIKMGNIKPLTGSAGEIRMNCRIIN